MRLISVSQSDTAPLIENVFDKLCNRLLIVAKNPKTPDFNHYLFETISAAIKFPFKVVFSFFTLDIPVKKILHIFFCLKKNSFLFLIGYWIKKLKVTFQRCTLLLTKRELRSKVVTGQQLVYLCQRIKRFFKS